MEIMNYLLSLKVCLLTPHYSVHKLSYLASTQRTSLVSAASPQRRKVLKCLFTSESLILFLTE